MANTQDYRTKLVQTQTLKPQSQHLPQQPYVQQSYTNLNSQLEKVHNYSNKESIQPKYSLETQQNVKQYLKADNTRLNYDNKNINLHNKRLRVILIVIIK